MKLKKFVLGVAAAAMVAALGAGYDHISTLAAESTGTAGTITINKSTTGIIPKGISYCGISLEGMTLEEAKSAVQQFGADMETRFIQFIVLGGEFNYNASSFGVSWLNPDVVSQLDDCVIKGNMIEQYKKQKDYQNTPLDLNLQFSLDEDAVRATVAEYDAVFSSEARNATIARDNGQWVVTEAVTGYSFDEAAISDQLLALIKDFTSTDAILYEFPVEVTYAPYDSSYFNFSATPLGSYTTTNLSSSVGVRRENIVQSANNMNGHVFYPGESISTLEMYGSVTVDGGYGEAMGYMNGKEVPSIGGGICQTTTTLYNAVLRAELAVEYRRPHSMMVSYVQPSFDATVDAASGSDFIFKNSLNYPIYIQSYVDGDAITVNIWGVEERPADRQISFRSEVLSLEWVEPYFTQIVDDNICTVGNAYVTQKIRTSANPHPKVHSKAYKVVTYNGQTTEELISEDKYAANTGVLYHASDCMVDVVAPHPYSGADAVYPGIGWTINLIAKTLSGENWPDPTTVGN